MNMASFEQRESERLQLQARLDSAKSRVERNRLGQFATPPKLAAEIVTAAVSLLPRGEKLRFLEPGFGTGAFYSSLLGTVTPSRIHSAAGFEIDHHYGRPAFQFWRGAPLQLHMADFTAAAPPGDEQAKFNVVICNPPYVRHHHLSPSRKRELQAAVASLAAFGMNGLSGLYCYFLILSQLWMARNGVAAWLLPSEFMDVKYGAQVKQFLRERVTLLRIHRFDPHDGQFGDALVSSAVVFLRNSPPPDGHDVEFTFAGTVSAPRQVATVPAEQLREATKWTSLPQNAIRLLEPSNSGTLADLFTIKRGLATGCNEFFVLLPERASDLGIPRKSLTPILPSPRDLDVDEIPADHSGNPKMVNCRLLLDSDLDEREVRSDHPALWRYLRSGLEANVHKRYLCRHRTPWYRQEKRPAAPFLCTYMGRPTRKKAGAFRFILNWSSATAANVYLLLYPRPALAALLNSCPELHRAVWKALSSIPAEVLSREGRTYGGGLQKLEPRELGNVPADIVLRTLPPDAIPLKPTDAGVSR